MRLKYNYLIFILFLWSGACISSTSSRISEEDISQVEKQIADAILANQVEKINSLLHEEYIFTNPNGVEVSKAKYLKDMQDGWHPTKIEYQKQFVSIHDHFARVIGEGRYEWLDNGKIYRYLCLGG